MTVHRTVWASGSSSSEQQCSVIRCLLESKKSRLVSDKSETKDKPERSERVF